MNFLSNLFSSKQGGEKSVDEFRKKMKKIDIPQIKITGKSIIEEGHSYENLHGVLKTFIDSTLTPIKSEKTIVGYFDENLGLKERKNGSYKYSDSHELFKPIVSLTRFGEISFESWIANITSLGEGNNVLVIWIHHSSMPNFFVCCRLTTGEYVAYFVDENDKTKKIFTG